MKMQKFLILSLHFLVVCLCGKLIHDALVNHAPVTFILSIAAWAFMFFYFEKRLNHDIHVARLFCFIVSGLFATMGLFLYILGVQCAGIIYLIAILGFAFWLLGGAGYHYVIKNEQMAG